MFKELLFRIKIKKLDEMHIKQYLERKDYELVNLESNYGQNLVDTLEIDDIEESGFVYKSDKLKYVFLGQAKNEDDRLMILLHECGHIELKHQSISKYNEAEAWSFAYNTRNICNTFRKIFAEIVLIIAISIAIVCFNISFEHTSVSGSLQLEDVQNTTESAISKTPSESQSDDKLDYNVVSENDTDVVYITPNGKRFHHADCYSIQNSNVIECSRIDIENQYTPCKICIKN